MLHLLKQINFIIFYLNILSQQIQQANNLFYNHHFQKITQYSILNISSNHQNEMQNNQDTQECVEIGHTIFTLKFFEQLYPKLSSAFSNPNNQTWNFFDNKKEFLIFYYAISSRCKTLNYSHVINHKVSKTMSNFFTVIGHITFSDLKSIYIPMINISSLEGLPFLQMENLEELHLHQNLITCFKPINKTNFKRLKLFTSYRNKSFSLQVNRMKWSCESVDGEIEAQIYDLRDLIKMEINTIRIIEITQKKDTIKCKRIEEQLKNKVMVNRIRWFYGC